MTPRSELESKDFKSETSEDFERAEDEVNIRILHENSEDSSTKKIETKSVERNNKIKKIFKNKMICK